MQQNAKSRYKVGIYYPLHGWGGSEAVAFWCVQALKSDYDVAFITFDKINPADVDAYYGTSLQSGGWTVVNLPLPFPLRMLRKKGKGALLLHHWGMRCLKRLSQPYDLLISGFNEFDAGKPGIQYIHFPYFAEHQMKALGILKQPPQWYYQNQLFRQCYHKLGKMISGFCEQRMRKNITLTNSLWTQRVIEQVYGIKARVVYPPVRDDFPCVPWEERENGFVCVGRISPEKRVESIVNVLARVKSAGFDVHLHIVGPVSNKRYAGQIFNMIREHGEWIELAGKLDRQQLVEVLTRHKYGIHAMKNEHFGIAVAEMIKAGMIVFVPDSGGPVEIVNNEYLIYKDEYEAVRKITTVLENRNLQSVLRIHLKKQASLFSEQVFMHEIKRVVDEILIG